MISQDGKTWQYYFLNAGLTLVAIGVIVVLLMFREILGLTFNQCYSIVMLCFLLIHYLHDHVLFSQPEVILIGECSFPGWRPPRPAGRIPAPRLFSPWDFPRAWFASILRTSRGKRS